MICTWSVRKRQPAVKSAEDTHQPDGAGSYKTVRASMKKETILKRIGVLISMVIILVTMLSSAAFAEDETLGSGDGTDGRDSSYWEYVAEVQKGIRMGSVGRYGMMPVYGQDVKDGTYEIEASSNSQYFKIDKAELSVKDGEMTAKITIPSMSYLYVYMGTSKDAAAASKKEQIDFKEVNNQTVFTVPVEALDKEIDIAAFSKARKKWYDRKVVFDASSLPEGALLIELPDYELIEDAIKAYGADEAAAADAINQQIEDAQAAGASEEDPDADPDAVKKDADLLEGEPVPVDINLPDGEYSIEVNMVGGSGRASISSPTWMYVKDGKAYAKLLWSSAHYDYMRIGDKTFYNETTDGGNSTFTIPIVMMDEAFPVIADTTAMGDPVEIRYEMTFYSLTAGAKGRIPQEAAKKVLIIAVIILVVGFVLNLVLKKAKAKKR